MKNENLTIRSDSDSSDGISLNPHTLTRRQFLTLAASTSAGLVLAACAPSPTPVPPTPTLAPLETTTIRLGCDACDAPVFAAENFLRAEGFSDVQVSVVGAAAAPPALASGKLDLGVVNPPQFINAIQSGVNLVLLGSIHAGCIEIWAPQSVGSLKDLSGKTVVVPAKALASLPYSYTSIILDQAGIDPKNVNFVVQADANPTNLYLDGKNDAIVLATTALAALKANPANKGHAIHNQMMDVPWSQYDCCFIVASQDWYRANPVAVKRALRAIYKTADILPTDLSAIAKQATDKGLWGGPASLDYVRESAKMVYKTWRDSDPEKSIRFYASLIADVGLLTTNADNLVKPIDLQILRALSTELKKTS
jgi:NitT/TauT family transport system substrate-binding protein